MNQALSITWFDWVPKVELHVHLEGAIPHDALWNLIQKYGGERSVPQLLEDRLGFSRNDTLTLIIQSILASWLAEDRKQQMIEMFHQDQNWQK